MCFLANNEEFVSLQAWKNLCRVVVTRVTLVWLFCLFSVLLFVYISYYSSSSARRVVNKHSLRTKCPVFCFVFYKQKLKDTCKMQVVYWMFHPQVLFVSQICGWDMAPVSSCDCPHLDCVGEVTKEELIQKSHVSDPPSWPCSLPHS